VNLLERDNDQFTFHLSRREKPLLLALLDRYPLIPARYQPLSRSAAQAESQTDQRLLDEALTEHRIENQSRLKSLLESERHFQQCDTGWRLVLSGSEMEWLLQVLNDVRVGSWVRMGSPEKNLWEFDLDESNAPHAWAMEIAGFFESALLEALHQDGGT
jgi:hypothetical protein